MTLGYHRCGLAMTEMGGMEIGYIRVQDTSKSVKTKR